MLLYNTKQNKSTCNSLKLTKCHKDGWGRKKNVKETVETFELAHGDVSYF